MTPNKEPYQAISITGDDDLDDIDVHAYNTEYHDDIDNNNYDDDDDDDDNIAVQTLDLRHQAERAAASSSSSISQCCGTWRKRCVFLAIMCVLGLAALGGREYYYLRSQEDVDGNNNYDDGEGGVKGMRWFSLFTAKGVRGSDVDVDDADVNVSDVDEGDEVNEDIVVDVDEDEDVDANANVDLNVPPMEEELDEVDETVDAPPLEGVVEEAEDSGDVPTEKKEVEQKEDSDGNLEYDDGFYHDDDADMLEYDDKVLQDDEEAFDDVAVGDPFDDDQRAETGDDEVTDEDEEEDEYEAAIFKEDDTTETPFDLDSIEEKGISIEGENAGLNEEDLEDELGMIESAIQTGVEDEEEMVEPAEETIVEEEAPAEEEEVAEPSNESAEEENVTNEEEEEEQSEFESELEEGVGNVKTEIEEQEAEEEGGEQNHDESVDSVEAEEVPVEAPAIDKSALIEEQPDYFVPLTPEERETLKNKLRATVILTKLSLINQASGKQSTEPVSPQRTLILDAEAPKQFMHMHHMKTGGTSMDGLIHCALNRQKDVNNGTRINYNSLSECGPRVKMCMDDLAGKLNASVVENVFFRNDENGQPMEEETFDPADESLEIPIDDLNVCSTAEANVMSYCASLHAVRTFGWKDVDKITVIRNPIDRAWSMYRFTLQSCYQCQPMSDVLERVANGTFVSRRHGDEGEGDNKEPNFVYSPNDSCAVQMIGHQATNLLSSIDLYNVANDVRFPREKEIAEEAVRNLREEFTWIGLTDRLEESTAAFREVFPFLAENLSEEAKRIEEEFLSHGIKVTENPFGLPEGYNDEKGCPLRHENAGKDPTCGTTEMDDYTISLVKKLSNRDVAVYKAAVERFEIQMEVLEELKNSRI